MKLRSWTAGNVSCNYAGVRPFFSEKYDITKHPKYKYLSDFDKKNAFDMEKHLRGARPAIVKPDDGI